MASKGITIGEKHTYDDFGLILSSKEVGMPDPHTEKVTVVGRDGDLDLTDYLGNVTFGNRKLTFTFTLRNALRSWAGHLSNLMNYLHGQKMMIILDDDPEYYYFGRCTVNSYKSNKTLGTIVVECDCEPYKYEIYGAGTAWLWDPFSFVDGIIYNTDSLEVDGELTVNLINRCMVVSPTFTCSSAMTVTYGGTDYALPAGTTTISEIRLQAGDNYVTITGSGTVTIAYNGGSL